MENSRVIVSPEYNKDKVVEGQVEKYKQPGLANLTGNKNKKWLRLDMGQRRLIYSNSENTISKEGKAVPFDTINNIIVNLSKPGRYYIELLTNQRCLKFKVLNPMDWVAFMDGLKALIFSKDGTPLFAVTEGYLKAVIALKSQSQGQNQEMDRPKAINQFSTNADAKPKPKYTQPTEMICKQESRRDHESDTSQRTNEIEIERETSPKNQTRAASKDKNGDFHKKGEPQTLEKKPKQLDSDSEEFQNPTSHKKEVLKNRRNV